jgi:hypothetical protein
MAEVQSSGMNVLPALFSLAQQFFGLFSIVGFPWLWYIPSLVDVIMATKACTSL